jgi:hypothetical protein
MPRWAQTHCSILVSPHIAHSIGLLRFQECRAGGFKRQASSPLCIILWPSGARGFAWATSPALQYTTTVRCRRLPVWLDVIEEIFGEDCLAASGSRGPQDPGRRWCRSVGAVNGREELTRCETAKPTRRRFPFAYMYIILCFVPHSISWPTSFAAPSATVNTRDTTPALRALAAKAPNAANALLIGNGRQSVSPWNLSSPEVSSTFH